MKPKKFVLLRTEDGKLYAMARAYFEDLVMRHPKYDQSVIVAEADEMLSLMRFKSLTEET